MSLGNFTKRVFGERYYLSGTSLRFLLLHDLSVLTDQQLDMISTGFLHAASATWLYQTSVMLRYL